MNIYPCGPAQNRVSALRACLDVAVKNAMESMTNQQLESLMKSPLIDFQTAHQKQAA